MKNMTKQIISWASFACLSIGVLISPWFFGAWEMWWFWPFAITIFAGSLLFAIQLMMDPDDALSTGKTPYRKLIATLSCLPFLIYALIRFMQCEVFIDAERSFLLHFTGFLVAIQIAFGFTRKQVKLFFFCLILDLFLLGLYGICNHYITGSQYVMWAPGFEQYLLEDRATGSFFCPDHYSGAMELALCLCIGLLAQREKKWHLKVAAGILAIVSIYAVILSKSRGGGLTVITILAFSLLCAFYQWPRIVRWYARGTIFAAALLILFIFCNIETDYMNRFKGYFNWKRTNDISFEQPTARLKHNLRSTTRGHMFAGAYRAWKTNKLFGIGPGMHKNVWPHYATSNDGDREKGIWPTYFYITNHSYRVHSDWLQLLEEYGLIGFLLFLIPLATVSTLLFKQLKDVEKACARNDWHITSNTNYSILLAGFLAVISMTFHSLGDFNLQMPALTWLLSAIIALAFSVHTKHEDNNNK